MVNSIVKEAGIPDWAGRLVLQLNNLVAGFNAVWVKITQLPSGFFWQNTGANVDRLNDRVFIGAATLNDGDLVSPNLDYLSIFQASIGDFPSISLAQSAVLSQDVVTPDVFAFVAGTQAKFLNSANSSAIGIGAYAINNHATLPVGAWALYTEGHHKNGAGSPTYGAEFEVRNTVASVITTPYAQDQGQTFSIQIGSGAGVTGVGTFNNTGAINVQANPKPFNCGINIGDGSVADAFATGFPPAIQLATDMAIQWFDAAAGGTPSSRIHGGADLSLEPIAAAQVKFANAGSFSVNGAVATAVTGVGPTGAHTTVQEWLTIKNAAGVVRYIPCF